MLFLTTSGSTQPDYVALAMILALALLVAVMTVRKYLTRKNAVRIVSVPAPVDDEPASPRIPAAPGSAGKLKLHDVEPKTAAMLMANTADKMGKPLNELRFISIKEVK